MLKRIATETLASAYVNAKLKVLASGFGPEIIWQKTLRMDALTEGALLRECAWVILSSGMRESVIRGKFGAIGRAFLDWTSAKAIVRHREHCVRSAFHCFRHKGKIDAIAESANIVHTIGFEPLCKDIVCDPIATLQRFPYIGPTTSLHIAKNIGLHVTKPDRHLCRLAMVSGYERVEDFCNVIAEYVGDSVPVVDLVLWRFATLHRGYLTTFLQNERKVA